MAIVVILSYENLEMTGCTDDFRDRVSLFSPSCTLKFNIIITYYLETTRASPKH